MLPYGIEVLFALHARHLREQWPFAVLLVLATLAVLALAGGRGPRGGRAAGALLAAGWLWVGAVFHLRYFATINFAAPVYGGLFILQGALLLWQGPVRGRLALAFRPDATGWLGMALVAYAVAGYPLVDQLTGDPGGGLRLAGLAPGPTAVFTLGVLLQCPRPVPLLPMAIPLLWTAVAAYGGWVLALPADLVLPALGAAALAGAVARNRRGAA